MIVIKRVPFVTEKVIKQCQEWANSSGNTYEVTNGRKALVIVRPKNNGGAKNGNH